MNPPSPFTTAVPPLSPYGTLQGTLFQYKPFPSLVAFESPSKDCNNTNDISSLPKNKCILLGGLSDGLLPVPYTQNLEHILSTFGKDDEDGHDKSWSLVQPILSSSYTGFGHGSLERDTEELCTLMRYLKEYRNAENFALIGHSTGCQNSMHFTKFGDTDLIASVKAIALQAPVSDREGAMIEPNYAKNIETAHKLASQGRAEEMMPRDSFWAPITASRFLSLQDKGGEDDFFSSDLTDEELLQKLSHVGQCGISNGLKVLVAFSGEDEYVPGHVDKDMLLERLCQAMNHKCAINDDGSGTMQTVASPLMLKEGNHNLSREDGDKDQFVEAVQELLKSVTGQL